ncbi:hypothetical protein L1987_38705 [Smallanthus sonchifolius]|uniref:Uncharacterized protein n=1 Tax=Smallanthus sonchifolius TaxID=185202 RepID=A0ACB9HJE5_9ASTR|nr:hypothetical protein L1987_38705 [Smallanthus sonchifolius]
MCLDTLNCHHNVSIPKSYLRRGTTAIAATSCGSKLVLTTSCISSSRLTSVAGSFRQLNPSYQHQLRKQLTGSLHCLISFNDGSCAVLPKLWEDF